MFGLLGDIQDSVAYQEIRQKAYAEGFKEGQQDVLDEVLLVLTTMRDHGEISSSQFAKLKASFFEPGDGDS